MLVVQVKGRFTERGDTMGRPKGSKNRQTAAGEKPWRIGALVKDKDLQREIKYRALDDEMTYEELVLAGIRLYLLTPSKNPKGYSAIAHKVLREQTKSADESAKKPRLASEAT
jgi:hypothetical protein